MRKFVVFLALAVAVPLVSGVPVSVETIDKVATPENPANFSVNIENNLSTSESFRVTASGTNPSWYYVGNAISIEPGEKGSVPVYVTPPENAIQNNYNFDLYVNRIGTSEYQKFQAFYRVKQPYSLQLYSTSLEPGEVRPGDKIEVVAKIRNLESRTIDDYRIEVSYPGGEKSQTSSPIIPSGEREFSFTVPVKETASPGEQSVAVKIFRQNTLRQEVEKKFTVLEHRNLTKTVTEDDRILVYTKELSVTNNGNTPANITLNETIPDYLSPVAVFSQEPRKEGSRYIWQETISPGETFSVNYRINYWIPSVAVVVLLAGMLALKRLRGSIKFEKKIEKRENGLKISIELMNPSERTYEDLEVRDFVPDVAKVSEEFDMAHPVVRKTSEGTELEWSIGELSPGEQRVLQYVIKPKIEVEGGITLKGAELHGREGKIDETEEVDSEFTPQ